MPEKITDFLTQGLPAKIYLLCFLKPRSGYDLANTIYGKPTTAKIYHWTRQMVQQGFLDQDKANNRFNAKVEPLVERIIAILKDHGLLLDAFEQKFLTILLADVNFRDYFTMTGEKEILQRQTNTVNLVDDTLSLLASLFAHVKSTLHIPDIQDQKRKKIFDILNSRDKWELQKDDLGEALKPISAMTGYLLKVEPASYSELKQIASEDVIQRLVRSGMWIFLLLPNAFLEKISKLSRTGQNDANVIALLLHTLGVFEKEEGKKK